MNTDIRISVEFFDHTKTKKLALRLGDSAPVALIHLWIYAAKHRSEGALSGMDAEDIALAARWKGDPQQFVKTLIDLRWIDVNEEGALFLHDWKDHNFYAAAADERSDAARLSRLCGTNPPVGKFMRQRGVKGISSEDYRKLKDESLDGVRRSLDGVTTPVDVPSTPALAPAPAQNPPPRVERGVGESPGARPKSNGGSRPHSRKGGVHSSGSKTPFPEDFAITPELQAWADERGYREPLSRYLEDFRDKCLDRKTESGDWNAAFRRAVRDDWAGLRTPTATGAPGGRRKGQTLIEHMYESHARLDARLAAQNAAGARPALEAELVEDIFHVH